LVDTINAVITHVEYYLPKEDYSNKNLTSKTKDQTVINSIIAKVGIDQKFAAEKNEFSTDLGVKAATKILEKTPNLINEIDFVIFCTQSPEHVLPSGSSFIQKSLFPSRSIGAIDISLGCSGFAYCLSIAQSLIQSSAAKKVLLITAETYSKYISSENTSVRTIFGDGACASVIKASGSQKVKNFKFDYGTDGSGIYDLIVPGSGLKNLSQIKSDNNKSKFIEKIKEYELFMDGPKMFTFALKAVPITIKETLKINKLEINDIDVFILHQANKFMLDTIRKKLEILESKFYIGLSGRGNTTSSTIPIALYDAIKEKIVKKDMNVLICGFGVGLSWATSVIHIDEELIKNVL
jgi:3-oxoacyl-[acyl-carrier-protein] synthase III